MIKQKEKIIMLELINRETGCERCGKKATVLHHIQRRVNGGKDVPRNLMGLCVACHKEFHFNEPGIRKR